MYLFFDRSYRSSVTMTAFTSGVNASSFLPSLYAFYNFTSANSFTTSQSPTNGSMTSALEQTTNVTEPFLFNNATDYDTTFIEATTNASFHTMTSSSTSSSFSSSSLSSSSPFPSTAGRSTGIISSEAFPFSADADFTTDFTSGFQSTHAQSVYTQTIMRVGSYGSEAVAAASTEVASLQQLTGGHYYAAGIVVGTLAVLFILSAFGLLLCRRRMQTYHSLPSGSTRNYDYLYRPLNKAGRLNEEYDHTFVGVSIPLLQEVTIV